MLSEFCHSPVAGPPCSTAWLRLVRQDTRLIRHGKAEHGPDRPWIESFSMELHTRERRPFMNEDGIPQTRHCLFPSVL